MWAHSSWKQGGLVTKKSDSEYCSVCVCVCVCAHVGLGYLVKSTDTYTCPDTLLPPREATYAEHRRVWHGQQDYRPLVSVAQRITALLNQSAHSTPLDRRSWSLLKRQQFKAAMVEIKCRHGCFSSLSLSQIGQNALICSLVEILNRRNE